MELRDIEHVLKIAEEHSLSNAAQKLFITQPSLSKSIARIESSLGLKLFDRTTKPLKLTFAGEEFVKTGREIIGYKKQLLKQMKDISDLVYGKVSLGVSNFRGKYFLPRVMKKVAEKYPGIRVEIYENNSLALEQALLAGDIDFCIEMLPVKNDRLTYKLIHEELHLIATSKNHPLKKKAKKISSLSYPLINLQDLRDENFIYLPMDYSSRMLLNNFFAKEHFEPASITEVKNMETAHALAVAGLGIGFISKVMLPLCKEEYLGNYFILDGCPNKLQLSFVYKKNAYLSKSVLAFWEIIKEIYH